MIKLLERIKQLDKEIQRLNHITALMEWDQETFMPSRGIDERSEQIALVKGMIHDKTTNPEYEEILDKLGATEENPSGTQTYSDRDRSLVRGIFRRYNREKKVPGDLVRQLARQTSLSQANWVRARQARDYTIFKPYLEKLVNLQKEKAQAIGYDEDIYDAFLDEHEPWMKTSELDKIFESFTEELKILVQKITDSPVKIREDFLYRTYPLKKQEAFGKTILKKMGFDFQRGRLDNSEHPFTITLGGSDIRITTRYMENNFPYAFFSTVHEGGHALYELGFGEDIRDTFLAEGTSLGIHESQSRMWENMIARSLPFWEAFYPLLKEHFPGLLDDVSTEEFYKAINLVQRSLIRTEADEVSYNLHIIIRYNLERDILSGKINLTDLPEIWNNAYEDLLGIRPGNPKDGVLQDVHWSMGGMGYFPTYTLGNLYAAQFYDTMARELGDIQGIIRKGDIFSLFSWLREKIHIHGGIYSAGELCHKVTGKALNSSFFMKYLEEKYATIYNC